MYQVLPEEKQQQQEKKEPEQIGNCEFLGNQNIPVLRPVHHNKHRKLLAST